MDDYRVMFYAKNRSGQGVFIWDTRTNVVTKYADAVWKVCYDRETQYIYYAVKQEKGFTHVKHGKMGEEKLEVIANNKGNLKKLSALNPFTCVPREEPSAESHIHYTFLRPGHGYITTERAGNGDPRMQYVNERGEVFPLPIYFQTLVGFFQWQNAYFVWNSGWARGGWLYPDKGFQEVPLEPPDPSMSGSKLGFPVRSGFLFISHDIDSVSDPGKSGIYFLNNDRYARAIVGVADAVSISPDGCKAAFVHEPSLDEARQGKRTAKMISFCKNN